jgi:hypothetical protein
MQVWVKITDLPVGLRNREAIAYLVLEFATLLECDISSLNRADIPWCRILLEVADSEVVLTYQWIEYLKRSNMKKIFKIFFSVDQILPRASPTGLGKRSTYWRPIEPGPKQFATGKLDEVGDSSLGGGLRGSDQDSSLGGLGGVVGGGSGNAYALGGRLGGSGKVSGDSGLTGSVLGGSCPFVKRVNTGKAPHVKGGLLGF